MASLPHRRGLRRLGLCCLLALGLPPAGLAAPTLTLTDGTRLPVAKVIDVIFQRVIVRLPDGTTRHIPLAAVDRARSDLPGPRRPERGTVFTEKDLAGGGAERPAAPPAPAPSFPAPDPAAAARRQATEAALLAFYQELTREELALLAEREALVERREQLESDARKVPHPFFQPPNSISHIVYINLAKVKEAIEALDGEFQALRQRQAHMRNEARKLGMLPGRLREAQAAAAP